MGRVRGPSTRVLRAFGLHGVPELLAGGRGTSWLVGDVVLKPDVDLVLQVWLGTEVAGIRQDGFRLAEVLQSSSGDWVVDGWGATVLLPGQSSETSAVDWPTVVETGRAFHRSAAVLARPSWLTGRRSWWAQADAATWQEIEVEVIPALRPMVELLTERVGPLGADQLVHADLTGNVLLTSAAPPGIIDISPYWRPPAYADGIVVADAMCWHHAPATVLKDAYVSAEAVARGLLFRVLTTNEVHRALPNHPVLADEVRRYLAVVTSLGF